MRAARKKRIPNKQLKAAREALGYSRDEVAEATETTEQSVARWERGVTIPYSVHIAKLCNFLGKTAEDLGYPETTVEESTGQDLHQFPHEPGVTQEQISAIEPTTGSSASPGHLQATHMKSPVWEVPKRNAFFTGREDVLKQIRLLFQESTLTRPVAITGLGGIGKTQVAIEYAWKHRQNYHTVLWIKADSLENLTREFLRLAHALDLPQEDSAEQNRTIAAIKRWLEEQQNCLLIIDNVETPEMLHPFLPEECAGHILLTTRAQATGNLAQPLPLREMELAEGALLLLRRAQILASGAALGSASQTDQNTAKAIAR
jgi:transcriptional regulator with XRE-family HTH domain